MQGWVQEMWGYSIAAASVGIKHRLVRDMQTEASSLSGTIDPAFDKFVGHFTCIPRLPKVKV